MSLKWLTIKNPTWHAVTWGLGRHWDTCNVDVWFQQAYIFFFILKAIWKCCVFNKRVPSLSRTLYLREHNVHPSAIVSRRRSRSGWTANAERNTGKGGQIGHVPIALMVYWRVNQHSHDSNLNLLGNPGSGTSSWATCLSRYKMFLYRSMLNLSV